VKGTIGRVYTNYLACVDIVRQVQYSKLASTSFSFAQSIKVDPNLLLKMQSLNVFVSIESFVSIKDQLSESPPDHLPPEIDAAFREGAACLSIGCFNAAGTMFRLCADLATRPLLPPPDDKTKVQPNGRQRRDLGLRLPWLFENDLLPRGLHDLAQCIRDDGNDGAHVASLKKADAEDLLDFSRALLERLITEPKRLELADARRIARRKDAD
jgi:Domain of unknown function (DUF4145)